jgi:hypothetical protein
MQLGGVRRLRLLSRLQSPGAGERLRCMVAKQNIVVAINEQIGNEFGAMVQY